MSLDGAIRRAKAAQRLESIQKVVVNVSEDVAAVREASDLSKLDGLRRAKRARYDSHRTDVLGGCLDGTRVDLLKEIYTWADRDDEMAPQVYWVNGLAGTGKTTVAYTLAERARQNGNLGATFFFAKDGEAELHDPSLVFSTLAHQLSSFSDDIAKEVGLALKSDPDVAYSSIGNQWEQLIAAPLRRVSRSATGTVVVVLDALDECDEAGCMDILRSILSAPSARAPLALKFFITSRPEAHIRSVFKQTQETGLLQRCILHNVDASIVSTDIRLYLRSSLSAIPAALDIVLPEDWITPEELEVLVAMAGSLFVVAATLIRFIGDPRVLSPREQLDIVLGMSTVPSVQPYASLDALYLRILHNSISSSNETLIVSRLQLVLGTFINIYPPPSLRTLEKLACLPTGAARSSLKHLHSVLIVPESDEGTVEAYHPSFTDFVRDPRRCQDERFRLYKLLASKRMASWCLKVLNTKLKKEALRSDSVDNQGINDLKAKFNAAYPPELQYASNFFVLNIDGSWLEDAELKQALHLFGTEKFVYWMEFMSYRVQLQEWPTILSWTVCAVQVALLIVIV